MSILVVGSVAFDTISTPLGKCREVLGGSATYFSLSARFFSPVNLVAVVGEDFPARYIKFFKDRGIDITGLKVAKGKTFRWEGEYGWDLNSAKTIATHLNVFATFNPNLPEKYRTSKYVFLANIDPKLQENVLRQVSRPKLVACDTMNHWIENKRTHLIKFLKKVDIFFLNDSEARQLSGENSLVKAAKALRSLGPRRIIIKKGEHGALLFSEKSLFSVPAFLLEDVYDPTGAGDTFAGGVVGYLARASSLSETNFKQALVYGSVMATFAVEDFSLRRLRNITKQDIAKRLREFRRLTCF